MCSLLCSEFCSTRKPTPLLGGIIFIFLAICTAVSVRLIKGKKTRKLKLASNTSSIIITRFKTQNLKEEPFMAFDFHYHDEHKDLNDVGAWAKHDIMSGTPHDWNNDTLPSVEELHPDLDASLTTAHR